MAAHTSGDSIIRSRTRGVNACDTANITAASSSRNVVPCQNTGPMAAWLPSPLRRAIRICAPTLNPNPSMKIAM